MDEGPVLLATKLHPPRAGGVLARPRLVRRLRPTARRLTLLDAPAGWGKTSLLAQWYRAPDGGARVAWLGLDTADNDPVLFWSYVVAALRTVEPGIGTRTRAVLRTGGRALRAFAVPALVDDLAAVAEPLVLVLDDFHVITDPTVHETVSVLVERLPAQLHLVVATRGDPPLPLGKLRAAGELRELRTDDLAFTDHEVERLLVGHHGLDLTTPEVTRLARRTEGWPVGLALAAASLADRVGSGDGALAAFVDEFTGTDRYVLDYLCSEVLAELPAELADFLLHSSVLSRMSAPLCEAVTGRVDAAAILRRVERGGVFVVRLDANGEWYRYHRLFGELLRHELDLADPAAVPELHGRAARWWAGQGSIGEGSIGEAVAHFVSAGDPAGAAELVALHWNAWFNAGRLATVAGWLDLLPPSLVTGDARLCAARAWLLLDTGHIDDVDRWIAAGDVAAHERTVHDGTAGDELRDLAVLRSVHRFKIGDLAAARAAATRVLELDDGRSAFAATVAHLMLGITAFWNDDLVAARRPLREAVRLARRGDNALGAAYGLGYLALVSVDSAGLDDAARLVPLALEQLADDAVAEHFVATLAHLADAALRAASGHPEQAARAAHRAVELAHRGAGRLELARALAVAARTSAAVGRDGREPLDRARALIRDCPDPGRLPAQLAAVQRALAPRGGRPVAVPDGAVALSERERDLLPLLAGTLSQREIGAVLHLSLNTVKTHNRSLFRKLGVSSRAAAVRRAQDLGLL
ncbi:MAG: LuxR C-terminal-related transcriptional regulator [Pseudonocardia sp.]